jgi:hypothetical protein
MRSPSEFHFLVGSGQIRASVAKTIDRIAREEEATFVNVKLPGDGWRYWCAGPNHGDPFNQWMRDRVLAGLQAEKLVGLDGKLLPSCFGGR